MRDCATKCANGEIDCEQRDCRMWIDYGEDHNCTLIAVNKHGPMTFKEIAKRHRISIVRVKQIMDQTLLKIKKVVKRSEY
jgi:hypothetical protein